MIKKIAVILFFTFFGQPAFAQSLVDTPRIVTTLSMNLAGPVDSVSELTLSVKVLDIGSALKVNGDTNKVITVPDTSFNILEERGWKFDASGKLLSEVFRSTDNKRTALREVSANRYSYKKGHIEYVTGTKDGHVIDSVAYMYSGGRLSMLEQYDGDKRYTGRIQYFTNKDKVLSTISYKDKDLELIKMTKYWYDPKKTLLSRTDHDNTQRLLLTTKYEVNFDSADRKHVMMFDYAKPDTCTGMTSYLLDESGNHLEDVTQDARGNVSYYSTNVYNEYGHITEQVAFTDSKVKMTYTYEYDDHKNWILKRIYTEGVPTSFVRRTFFYRSAE